MPVSRTGPSLAIASYVPNEGVHPLDTKCKVCVHPDRNEVDRSVLNGVPISELSAHYSLSKGVLRRHRRECIKAVVTAAVTYGRVQRGIDTLATAEDLQRKAERLGEKAEAKGDLRTALLGVREEARSVELVAKLRGELDAPDGPLTDPRWLRLRDALVVALRPYPDAARAVAAVLVQIARPRKDTIDVLPEPAGPSEEP